MGQEVDIQFMKRAIDLAENGYGHVNPNPLVGALIVKNGKIISEGFHEQYGKAHAEINAINNTKQNLKGATLYVTLEPCNHQGKTPPCSDRIIREGIQRVVIGMKDPNKKVPGNGHVKLREAGLEVTTGILEDEVEKQNEVFIKYIKTGIPFCVLKTAMTLDGKISTYTGDSKWITNERSRKFVHQLRHRYSAVMTGVNTIIKDNPLLNDRSGSEKPSHPLRVVVDSGGRTPLDSQVLDTKEVKTVIAVTDRAPQEFRKSVEKRGAELIICPSIDQKVDLIYLVNELGKKGIDSILLEGGSTLNFSALRQGIIDKVYSFISAKMVGGQTANTPMGGTGFEKIDDAITMNITGIEKFENDILVESYLIKK